MKTSELTGPALDWAVAKCESLCLGNDIFGLKPIVAAPIFVKKYKPSTDWTLAGPIIERERITINPLGDDCWEAYKRPCEISERKLGPTPLIAAMRCYIASKLGEEVEIPEELK